MMLKVKNSDWACGLLLATLFVGAQAAKADPIGGPNDIYGCEGDSCQGSTYWLLNLGTVVSNTTDILYRIDTSTYTGSGTFIDAAAIKVLSSMASFSLVGAPGGVGSWAVVLGGINASGCSGDGGGFGCADDLAIMSTSSSNGNAPVGGILEWVFRVPGTGPFLDAASIKARYIVWDPGNENQPGEWQKTGALVSEDITLQPIPEPTSLLLLGTGLLAIGKLGHKYRKGRRPS